MSIAHTADIITLEQHKHDGATMGALLAQKGSQLYTWQHAKSHRQQEYLQQLLHMFVVALLGLLLRVR